MEDAPLTPTTRLNKTDSLAAEAKSKIQKSLIAAASPGRSISLELDLAALDDKSKAKVTSALQAIAAEKPHMWPSSSSSSSSNSTQAAAGGAVGHSKEPPQQYALPRRITFPYSRHSSYPELCRFVDTFRPRDVWPCTVDPEDWARQGAVSACVCVL